MLSDIAFCNTFDLHSAIIRLENQFVVFLRVLVLHRFYCKWLLAYRKVNFYRKKIIFIIIKIHE